MRIDSVVIPALRAVASRPRLTALVFARDPWGNPFSAENVADPYPTIARMWADGPVTYRRFWGRWFVVGYEECQTVANHPAASAGQDFASMLTEVHPYRRLAPRTKDFFRNWILIQDPPDHTRLRKLVSRPFTPRRIAALEPLIATTASELLDGVEATLAAEGSVDLFPSFNRPLPVRVIGAMLGLPPERWEWAGEVVATIATFLDPLNSFDVRRIDDAVDELRAVVLDLAAARRRDPADDLLSALVAADDDGERLTEEELVSTVGLLVFAGHDTTTNMLGNALIALAAHPDQRALVRDDPDLWPNAVEELLRWDTTAVATVRRVTEDIDVGAVTIPAGSSVMLQLNGANRDPRRWEDPDRLRLDRADPRPLSFGHGLHHCLGHVLARTELRIALRAAVERLGDYRIAPNGVEWRRSAVLRGPKRLVVTAG